MKKLINQSRLVNILLCHSKNCYAWTVHAAWYQLLCIGGSKLRAGGWVSSEAPYYLRNHFSCYNYLLAVSMTLINQGPTRFVYYVHSPAIIRSVH